MKLNIRTLKRQFKICCNVLPIMLAVHIVTGCVTEDINTGQEELQKGIKEYYFSEDSIELAQQRAIGSLQQSADKGNADALYLLGTHYLLGKDVIQSTDKAVDYFEKAAKQGHIESQLILSTCYYNGIGVEVSKEKGDEWGQRAKNSHK